jgi:hypothetical protein
MARKGKRRRLDRGIYEDASGFAVVVKVRGQRQERRFAPGWDLEFLRFQRDRLVSDLRRAQDEAEARRRR